MKLLELQAYRLALRTKLTELERIDTSCMGCSSFADGRVCQQFGEAPPVEFRKTQGACDAWQWDEVPF